MLFSSNVFLFVFLPCVLLLHTVLPQRLKNGALLLFSLLFYGWGEPAYLLLMLAVIALDYVFGLWICARKKREAGAKLPLVLGIAVNLLILGFFKYAGFFVRSLHALIPAARVIPVPEIPLPIGISFYIFQSMSYVIDVYRGDAPVQRKLLPFATYVTLFPQLIAGPIVRYRDVADQLEGRRTSVSSFASGVRLFIVGLSKKLLLANPAGQLWELLQARPGTLAAWTGLLGFTLQIYFDFSGYSDMARGLGRMLGFEFLENFNYPYISRSVSEFWRRWHISLATWFREYVYIPLGGNRKGLARQLVNILIVWMLTGLWHGASFNFLLWGGYYALLLVAEKCFLNRILERTPSLIRLLYTLLAVNLGWVLFYFEDLAQVGQFAARLFTPSALDAQGLGLILGYLPLLVVGAVASTPLGSRLNKRWSDSSAWRWTRLALSAGALALCVAALASQSYNPFIYFRF